MVGGREAWGRVSAAVALLAVNGLVPFEGPTTATGTVAMADTASTTCAVTVGTATTEPALVADAARAVAAGFATTDCMPDAAMLAAAEARATIALGGTSPAGTSIAGGAAQDTPGAGAAVPTTAVALTPPVPPATAAAPATTVPATTAPATTAPATTIPATTVPATTVPTSTAPTSTAPTSTTPATTTPTVAPTTAAQSGGAGDTTTTTTTAATGSRSTTTSTVGRTDQTSSSGSSGNPDDSDTTSATGTGTDTAAARLKWGQPSRSELFDGDLSAWTVDDGPGHGGDGRRSPSAVTVANGVLTISGDADGTTGGLAWGSGATHGRWEARVKVPVGDPTYHAVMALRPDGDSPAGGEIDVMQNSDPKRQDTNFVLHYGADDRRLQDHVGVDATTWHNWAVEWSADRITAYLDGQKWYTTTRTSAFPPGPMHLVLRLDWFPNGNAAVGPSIMKVDRVRFYPIG